MKRKILLGLFSMFVVITGIFFVSRDHAKAEVANDVTSGLELQWKMNEDPGTSDIADTSSNHNAGTLYNTDIFTSRSTDVPYHSGSNSHSYILIVPILTIMLNRIAMYLMPYLAPYRAVFAVGQNWRQLLAHR